MLIMCQLRARLSRYLRDNFFFFLEVVNFARVSFGLFNFRDLVGLKNFKKFCD